MKIKLSFFVALILSLNIALGANLRLPKIVGDHMVLQQQSPVKIWGWAKAGSQVSIKAGWLQKNVLAKTDNSGKWMTSLLTPKAGGPYTITVSSDTTIILKDILIGEVWVCSGQSNMEMPISGYVSQPVNGANDLIAHGANNQIRLFKVKHNISTKALDDCSGAWNVSSPSEVSEFSVVGYVFGKYLQEVLGVPVGLIQTTWGGTRAEAWTSEDALQTGFKEVDLSALASGKINQNSPSVLFNAMVNPIIPFTMKGVIWYQGEANRNQPDLYARLFPGLISNWRAKWAQDEFPFYYVQIAPFKYDTVSNSAFLREAQLKSMTAVKNTGMAVTMDIGDYNTIHPAEKITVANRLAYWALAKTYNISGISFFGPALKNMKIEGKRISLSFDNAPKGLSTYGKKLEGFVVAGNDKVFYPAEAKIVKDEVVLTCDKVENPVAVRYCWENFCTGTLYNTNGLPASSFRTDTWER